MATFQSTQNFFVDVFGNVSKILAFFGFLEPLLDVKSKAFIAASFHLFAQTFYFG